MCAFSAELSLPLVAAADRLSLALRRAQCLREARCTIEKQKPIALMFDQVRGGEQLEVIRADECPEDLRRPIFDGREVIEWHRIRRTPPCTLFHSLVHWDCVCVNPLTLPTVQGLSAAEPQAVGPTAAAELPWSSSDPRIPVHSGRVVAPAIAIPLQRAALHIASQSGVVRGGGCAACRHVGAHRGDERPGRHQWASRRSHAFPCAAFRRKLALTPAPR